MGCDTYVFMDHSIRFDKMNDNVSCLCTFPYNDAESLSVGRLRSLAMLGASIALLAHEAIDGPVYLPGCLPAWFTKELDRLLPQEEE